MTEETHHPDAPAEAAAPKHARRPKPGPGRHGSGQASASARTTTSTVSNVSEPAPKASPKPTRRAAAEPSASKSAPPATAGSQGRLAVPKPNQPVKANGPLSLDDTISVTTALTVLRTPIVILHIETTGPDPLHDDILAIHAIRTDKLRPVEEFSTKILPLRALPRTEGADGDQTGRPPAKRQGVPLQEAVARFCQFLGTHRQHVFVHGSAGTQAFLGQAARQYGMSIENPVGDVVDLARLAWPDRADYSLAGLVADLLPAFGRIRTAADATRAILALLQAASNVLTANGGRVSRSVVHWGTSEACVKIRQMPW